MGVRTQAQAVVALIAALSLACGFMFMTEAAARPAALVAVQQAAGGLGLGASVVPAWSFNAFDPRQEPICESSDWPIPAGACYSPDHVGPVSHFRPPARGAGGIAGIPRLVRR